MHATQEGSTSDLYKISNFCVLFKHFFCRDGTEELLPQKYVLKFRSFCCWSLSRLTSGLGVFTSQEVCRPIVLPTGICLVVSVFFVVVIVRSFAEMETDREKSATPTRDHVMASSSAAAADGENRLTVKP